MISAASLRQRCLRLRTLAEVGAICSLLALVPYPTCVVKLATGMPCPGCGMTRASLRLLHGDLVGALRYHPVVLPGAVGLLVAVVLALSLPEGHPLWPRFVQRSLTALGLSLAVAWALRLAHVLPPV